MADAIIYDASTGEVHSIYRDPDKDFAGMVANKRLFEDQEIADALGQKPEMLISSLERLYFEHQAGTFEVSCRYSPTRDGFWVGDLTSESTDLQIAFEQSFFDQPKFR